MPNTILCVAEKPSIAKAVANHLGQRVTTHNVQGATYNKNYEFDYNFQYGPWGQCKVIFTSVAGHIMASDFDVRYKSWGSCQPQELFEARINNFVAEDKKAIAENIKRQARQAKALYIWTDCDREGEHIGGEIRDLAVQSKPRIEVMRAKFSNIERAHVIQAANRPIALDERQVNAVAARIELDLRIGSSFTRMQTLALKNMIEHLQEIKAISYGTCQFPTLGFVVDRYFRVRNFVPETFWKLQVMHTRDGINVNFNWKRVHLFDRMIVTILFEQCIAANVAKVTKLLTKPTSKWKPLPLTTVELQKCGSRFLRLDSQRIMKVAEELYTKGYISYPRTETDQFDAGIDLHAIIGKQTEDDRWGPFAQDLLDGAFSRPRNGRNNDQAHPPIHPVNYVAPHGLSDEEKRVYEFVVRRFLACCSEDAKGETSTIELKYGPEVFTASGLIVLQRNYLDVYPYDKWESSRQLPRFTMGETFTPSEAKMTDGKTSPPGYLTEPELIALMDVNGIGTDATMAEHIAKIKERAYVTTRPRAGGTAAYGDDDEPAPATRGGGRGRGRGRGRGGRGGGLAAGRGQTNGVQEFIPTTLGTALIKGYDDLGFEPSLSKPFLRKEMEVHMKAICAGTRTKNDVVHETLEKYQEMYMRTVGRLDVLKLSFRRYVLGEQDVQRQ